MLVYYKVSNNMLLGGLKYVVNWTAGSFVHLTPKTVPRHDIIVSTEGNDRHS